MEDKYLEAVEKCIGWVERQMLTFDYGYNGIYERIRIDKNIRTNWVRPDCNAEFARALKVYKEITGNDAYDRLFDNITNWIFRSQDNDPLSVWYGSLPFYLIDGYIEESAVGNTIYQNDNGKDLIALLQLFGLTKRECYLDSAVKLANYWINIQQADGTFMRKDSKTAPYPKGPCFILWLGAGLFMAYEATGNRRYYDAAEGALKFVSQYQVEDGRFKTSYELIKAEDWRPVSSETSIAIYTFSIAYRITGDEKFLDVVNRAGNFILSLQHERGGITNCNESCLAASLQNNRNLCDLVYTQGFALMAFIEAWRATGQRKYLEGAGKLGDFLTDIQCRNESPLWDGAWRGSYNIETSEWDGRANQNNLIDEGGMYSVYTGWCAAPIMYGLLMLLQEGVQ